MKKGEIVLGVAAAIVTISGAFAFKESHKYRIHLVYGYTTVNRKKCYLCASLWQTIMHHTSKTCYTAAGGGNPGIVITLTGLGLNNHTWYTQKINGECHTPTIYVTSTH